ncbi:glycosyltransferase family 4 protein [Flavobacterium sp. WC2416]|uniref:Glycosyltransferase family 4 protein n=1 Tax=Flavobacterium sp. WC2416 TaxID=3234141 RepID=A0AB39WDK6_9FLAO
MQFVIITHVPHSKQDGLYYAYAPYVREMNVWGENVDELVVVAPVTDCKKSDIDSSYIHQNIQLIAISKFDVLSLRSVLATLFKLPKIIWTIFKAMKNADHIHLRCPGNVGLVACFVQILFPNKIKTAKYAGNWDPQSKQPWTYQLQQWVLSNTFLTRNMQVLVYGEWEGMTENIKPFFTATYKEEDKQPIVTKDLKSTIKFVFVGTLVKGKNPLYAIQLVENLYKKGIAVSLRMYGEGIERKKLEHYVLDKNLDSLIHFEGNQSKERIQKAYQESHFVLLASESEGWPKAIAEGMFWGCVPIATAISCIPYMLDYGNRGVLLEMDLEEDCKQVIDLINNQKVCDAMQTKAVDWSRHYTLDIFESEIKKLLNTSNLH